MPRLKKIWTDAAYRGKELAEWRQVMGDEKFTRLLAEIPRLTQLVSESTEDSE